MNSSLYIPISTQPKLLLDCQYKDGCTDHAKYRTRCEHRFCEEHTIQLGDEDKWRCLESKCPLYIDPNDFRRISSEKSRTYEQIKTSAKFRVLGRVLVGLIGIGTFVGLTICLLNQEDDI